MWVTRTRARDLCGPSAPEGEYVVSPGDAQVPAAILAPNGTFTFGHTLLGTTAANTRLGSGFAN